MSEHYTPARIAKLYADCGYGRERQDDNDACTNATKEELVLGTLQNMIGSFDAVFGVVCEVVYKKISEKYRRRLQQSFRNIDEQIKERIDKHGPCPEELRSFLTNDAYDSVYRICGCGARYERLDQIYIYVNITPPPKGHPLRSVYDKWMKRKAPKKAEGQL